MISQRAGAGSNVNSFLALYDPAGSGLAYTDDSDPDHNDFAGFLLTVPSTAIPAQDYEVRGGRGVGRFRDILGCPGRASDVGAPDAAACAVE